VVNHSDHGCQYTSYAYGKRCVENGLVPSMGTVGDAYDNAMAESFFATLEREVLDRRRFKNQSEAKTAIFEWLEGWYNPHRRHSSLGYRSPMNYERHALAHPRHEAGEALTHADHNRGARGPRHRSDRGAQRFSVR
jgi:putative transposase